MKANDYLLLKETIFNNCTWGELQDLLNNKQLKQFFPGDKIFFEGEEAEVVVCLYDGEASVVKKNSKNKPSILNIAIPGTVLGVHDVINSKTYTATAVANIRTSACIIPKEDFLKLLKKNGNFAFNLMKLLSREIKGIENKISTGIKSIG